MNHIKINIVGQCGSGKSRLLFKLKEFLKEEGFNVNRKSTMDFQNEASFDNAMKDHIDECMEAIKGKTLIIMDEVQTNRQGVINE